MAFLSSLRMRGCALLLGAVLASSPLAAGPYADALGKSLVAATTPAEKLALVRWMFVAMSLHPGVKDLAAISPQQRMEANQAVGRMFTRLLTESCAVEAREAVKYEGMSAISSSFQLLGQVAAREIFGNAEVTAGLADLDKYIDTEKIKKVLGEPAPAK